MNAMESEVKESRCRICGQTSKNRHYRVKEMFFGKRDEFVYLACECCKCMQIEEVPDNLADYYGENYYSMCVTGDKIRTFPPVCNMERILDVGCGAGVFLIELAEKGCGNLYGCDPFIDEDIVYGDRIHISKCEITQMQGKYDRIFFKDSFEHVTTPLETLEKVKQLLDENGECILEIPIFPNAAFDTFGTNWYQLDAPRHIFLHSKESIAFLCEKARLKIQSIEYNSVNTQFVSSYLYECGIPLMKQIGSNIVSEYLPEEMLEFFTEATQKVNSKGYGDHAIFTLKHL